MTRSVIALESNAASSINALADRDISPATPGLMETNAAESPNKTEDSWFKPEQRAMIMDAMLDSATIFSGTPGTIPVCMRSPYSPVAIAGKERAETFVSSTERSVSFSL